MTMSEVTTPTPSLNMPTPERMRELLEGITEGRWYAYTKWNGDVDLHVSTPTDEEADTATVLFLACANTAADAALAAAAPTLARAHIALLAAHAEALERERIDLFSVDWATMPTETQDCLNWGRHAGGYFGPCGKCPACWLNQNMDALKELKEVNDKQRAEIIARDTIALVGTHGYAMNGPEEGELCEVLPTGEYRVLSSGEAKSIVDATGGEVHFLSETPPAQASAGGEG